MAERYDGTLQEVFAALLKEAADVASGALAALEEPAAAALKSKLAFGLQKIEEESDAFVKFAAEVADNPTAAVEYILGKADQATPEAEAPATEPTAEA